MSTRQHRQFVSSQRRHQVAELYLQGWSQSAIAGQVNADQSTINRDIKAIQKEWRASSVRNFDAARELEIRKIDLLEREAWAAWERSKKPSQAAVVTGEGPSQKTRKTMKNQVGDPRFLDQVNKCIAQRRTLLGLDAPLQVADVTPLPAESAEQRHVRLQQIFVQIGLHAPRLALPAPTDPES